MLKFPRFLFCYHTSLRPLNQGKLQINGKKVDGVAGTRTWSQYDKRTIYGVYDVLDHVVTGDNAIGVYAGGGW